MKYIIVKRLGEHAILFPEILTHKEVAGNRPVIAAGFVEIKGVEGRCGSINVTTYCYGRSISLDKDSRECDVELVNRALTYRI